MINWHAHFRYDADAGKLFWKPGHHGRGCTPGSLAGTVTGKGYVTVTVGQKKYGAHRVIWEMHNGAIPAGLCIDHIDGDPLNNRLGNLRVVTLSLNQRNRHTNKNSRLAIQGVYPKAKGFQVMCSQIYIGYFTDFFDACCARKSAELSAGYANHGRTLR